MRKIGVHFKNIAVPFVDGPFEAVDVSGSESQLPPSLFQENGLAEPGLQLPYDLRRSIGRSVVDHQNMKILLQVMHRLQDLFNILPFVICWNNDELLHGLSNDD